jgi:hypothetical protein
MVSAKNASNELDVNRRSVLGLATGLGVTAAASSVPQSASAAIRPSDIVMMDGATLRALSVHGKPRASKS